MRLCFYFIKLLSLTLLLTACSGGPAEKPLPDSITSPEKLLGHGIYLYNNNNYLKAIEDFEKALLQYRSIDHQYGIASSTLNLAKSLMAINNNKLAAQYLQKAEAVIEQASLDELKQHLSLLKSSLAIKSTLYNQAIADLEPVLNSSNASIKLAALKNRTKIVFLTHTDDQADDRQNWLAQYQSALKISTENKSADIADQNRSHQAVIYRLEAELAEDTKTKQALLHQSLNISRELANRPAIAATLSQSANIDVATENFKDAEDKYLRALFIRHQLGDVKNSLLILQKLQTVYDSTDNDRNKLTAFWIDRISQNDLSNWNQLYSDFETYPVIK